MPSWLLPAHPAIGVGTWGAGCGSAPHHSAQVKLHRGDHICEPWEVSLSSQCCETPVGTLLGAPGLLNSGHTCRSASATQETELKRGVWIYIGSMSWLLSLPAAFSQSICFGVKSREHSYFASCLFISQGCNEYFHCTCSFKLWQCTFFLTRRIIRFIIWSINKLHLLYYQVVVYPNLCWNALEVKEKGLKDLIEALNL